MKTKGLSAEIADKLAGAINCQHQSMLLGEEPVITNKAKQEDKETGTILIMVIFLSILLAGAAAYILARTRSELVTQRTRKYVQAATQYAISGMTISQVRINAGDWDAGPTGEMNDVLYNHDTSEGNGPGGYIIDDGTYSVRVNNLGDLWYELVSKGAAGDDFTGEIVRYVKLRARDRDFFSRWSLYLENGDGIVDDTNNWYGEVHTNEYLRMRNRIPGLGAHFYGNVTACNEPMDYAEVGGTGEAWYAEPPVWNAEEISLPSTTTFAELTDKAKQGSTATNIFSGSGSLVVKIYEGSNGIAIDAGADFKSITLRFNKAYSEEDGTHQEMEILAYDYSSGTLHSQTIDVPHNSIISFHGLPGNIDPVRRGIEGIEGDIYDRMTLACDTGYIKVSDDIVYVDEDDESPYTYKDWMPEDPNNFVPNPAYKGNACFAAMAKQDVLLTNQNGDLDLVMHGVYAAGVGDPAKDGAVRWLDTSEAGWSTLKRDLRFYGAMIADGVLTSTGMTIGHFKGWTSGGVHSGGYNNSLFKYDHKLRTNPPPDFMEINMPLYVGWQLKRTDD